MGERLAVRGRRVKIMEGGRFERGGVPMLYAALAFFVVSLVLLVLGFTGMIRGAAELANLTLMASLLLVAVSGLTAVWRRQLRHHH
jgi:uncharacterized membrane protein YtjA (UPF0391 family)